MERKLKLIVFILAVTFFIPYAHFSTAKADVTISYSDWQLAQDIWGRSLREAIAEFERLNPGIKVKTEPVALGQRMSNLQQPSEEEKGRTFSPLMRIL